MSDDTLRALERRFRETESVEDEVAWLASRLRAGEIDSDRLDLAAYCGDEAARRFSSRRPVEPSCVWTWGEGLVLAEVTPVGVRQEHPARWIRESTRSWASQGFAREICVRACLAAAESVAHAATHPSALACVRAAANWIEMRSLDSLTRSSVAEDEADEAQRELMDLAGGDRDSVDPAAAALEACQNAALASALEGMDLKAAARTMAAAAQVLPFEEVRARVAAALVQWALGTSRSS